MFSQMRSGRGAYTNFFTAIPANEVTVLGLPIGSAGSRAVFNPALSNYAAAFAIGPELSAILTSCATKKRMPSTPRVELLAA